MAEFNAFEQEREAVRRVVVAHHALVYRIAYRLLGNTADAEDAAQEVFLRYLEQRERWRAIESLPAWLAQLSIHASRNLMRAARNRRRRESRWALEHRENSGPGERHGAHDPSPGEDVMETRRLVANAVQNLPEELRLPIILHYQEGFRYQDIALALECPQGTIAKRIFTAKARLREQLKNAGHFALMPAVEGMVEGALAETPPIPVPAALQARLLARVDEALLAHGAAASVGGGARSGTNQTIRAGASRAGIWASLALIAGLSLIGSSFWPRTNERAHDQSPAALRDPAHLPSDDASLAEASSAKQIAGGAEPAVEDLPVAATSTNERAESSAPASAAPRMWITGHVRDRRGAGIAGANVRFAGVSGGGSVTPSRTIAETFSTGTSGYFAIAMAEPEERRQAGAETSHEPSHRDDSGESSVARMRSASPTAGRIESSGQMMMVSRVAAEGMFLEASAGGFITKRILNVPMPSEESLVVEFELSAECEIRGVVLTPDGEPIAEAAVEITAHDSTFDFEAKNKGARTDENGEFVLSELPEGRFLIEAKAAGFVNGRTIVAAPANDATIQLARAGALRVSLVNAGGSAEPDLEARLSPDGTEFVAYGITDSRGEVCFSDLAAGAYTLYAYRGGFALAAARVEIRAAEESAATLAVESGFTLTGRVVSEIPEVDLMTGVVLASRVAGTQSPITEWQEAKVSDDGAFEFRAMPPGAYCLAYRSSPAMPGSGYDAVEYVSVGPDSGSRESTIKLGGEPEATLAITVVDENDTPIAYASASLYRRYGPGRHQKLHAASSLPSADGTQTLRATAGEYELMISTRDGKECSPLTLAPGENVERRVFHAPKCGRAQLAAQLAAQVASDVVVRTRGSVSSLGYFEFINAILPGCVEIDPALIAARSLERGGKEHMATCMPAGDSLWFKLNELKLSWEIAGGKVRVLAENP